MAYQFLSTLGLALAVENVTTGNGKELVTHQFAFDFILHDFDIHATFGRRQFFDLRDHLTGHRLNLLLQIQFQFTDINQSALSTKRFAHRC